MANKVDGNTIYYTALNKRTYSYTIKIPKYYVVNKNDRSLQPILVMLPKPPKLELIDNVFEPHEKQVFKKTEYPEELKRLEYKILDKFRNPVTASSDSYTPQRFIIEMWKAIKKDTKKYSNEIKFLKREITRLRLGYWCVIDKTVTYIPPMFYFYLNYWKMDDVKDTEYRDRDLKWFTFLEYLYTTKENDRYRDINSRTFYGMIYPKHRRDGATHKSLSVLYYMIAMSDMSNIIAGIHSYTGTNSLEIYRNKLIPAFSQMKFFLRPLWKGSDTPEKGIKFDAPQYAGASLSLMSSIIPAETSSFLAFDGKKLHFYFPDESGKTKEVSVFQRWIDIKETLSTGKGSKIHGLSVHPSTVADMEKEGGSEFYNMLEQSKFYERNEITGQTKTGLARYFDTCFNGMESHIDIFGKAVVEDPEEKDLWRLKTPHRDKEGKLIGSRTYILSERKRLKESGKPQDIDNLVRELKLYPAEYLECFGNIGGGIGFNTIAIKERQDQILRMKMDSEYPVIKMDVFWDINGRLVSADDFITEELYKIKGITDGAKVVLVPTENGVFNVSYIPRENNKRIKINGTWSPTNPYDFTWCSDGYSFYKKAEKTKGVEVKQGTSDGATCCFWERDERIDPQGKDISNWESNRFVVSARYRKEIDVFCEEALMINVFFGGMQFPELNIKAVYKWYLDRGFDGYLLYDIDPLGKVKNEAGFYSQVGSKNDLFIKLKTHIAYHIGREIHEDILSEWGSISNMEEMTRYDLITGTGGCLLGSASKHRDILKEEAIETEDFGDFFDVVKM